MAMTGWVHMTVGRLPVILGLRVERELEKVTVIGATTWGTTLGIIIARKGIPVTILARSREEAGVLEAERQNSRFLAGVEFPEALGVSHCPEVAMGGAGMVVLAVPSNSFRDNVRRVRSVIRAGPIFLSASKGLEVDTGKRMSQVLEDELPPECRSRTCVLSGPNLAMEIAEGRLASSVVASREAGVAAEAQEVLMSASFRVYTNEDIIGVELGGALKNIIAMGAGICDGLSSGENGKAAFITRGLAEITRLGVAAGASPITFAGLAGLGDLMATCASRLSRNHFVGEQLAAGRPLKEILASMKNVAEGVPTTVAALRMAEELGVEMPIAQATYQVLFEGVAPKQAVAALMGRPPRSEWGGIS
jgi:glycerol-3-phosphate dehydrogenase (NAD(P)+)